MRAPHTGPTPSPAAQTAPAVLASQLPSPPAAPAAPAVLASQLPSPPAVPAAPAATRASTATATPTLKTRMATAAAAVSRLPSPRAAVEADVAASTSTATATATAMASTHRPAGGPAAGRRRPTPPAAAAVAVTRSVTSTSTHTAAAAAGIRTTSTVAKGGTPATPAMQSMRMAAVAAVGSTSTSTATRTATCTATHTATRTAAHTATCTAAHTAIATSDPAIQPALPLPIARNMHPMHSGTSALGQLQAAEAAHRFPGSSNSNAHSRFRQTLGAPLPSERSCSGSHSRRTETSHPSRSLPFPAHPEHPPAIPASCILPSKRTLLYSPMLHLHSALLSDTHPQHPTPPFVLERLSAAAFLLSLGYLVCILPAPSRQPACHLILCTYCSALPSRHAVLRHRMLCQPAWTNVPTRGFLGTCL